MKRFNSWFYHFTFQFQKPKQKKNKQIGKCKISAVKIQEVLEKNMTFSYSKVSQEVYETQRTNQKTICNHFRPQRSQNRPPIFAVAWRKMTNQIENLIEDVIKIRSAWNFHDVLIGSTNPQVPVGSLSPAWSALSTSWPTRTRLLCLVMPALAEA